MVERLWTTDPAAESDVHMTLFAIAGWLASVKITLDAPRPANRRRDIAAAGIRLSGLAASPSGGSWFTTRYLSKKHHAVDGGA